MTRSLSQLLAEGRIQEAQEAATHQLAQHPDDEEALLVSAKAALMQGRLEQADHLLSRVRSKERRQDVTLMHGTVALLREDYESAREFYQSLTQQLRPPADAWHGLGMALLGLGRALEACQAHEHAVALEPHRSGFRYELGHALVLEKRERDAVHQFVEGLRLEPRDSRGYWAISQLLAARRRPRSSRRILELGLKHAPDSRLLRETLLAQRQPEPTPPGASSTALLEEIAGLLERKHNREARELARQAWARGTRSLPLKLMEAEACRSLKPPDMPGALHAYEEAITLAPGDWVPYTYLGTCLLMEGHRHVPRAIQLLERAHQLEPARPETALNLVLGYVKGERIAEARELARQAVAMLPPEHPQHPQAVELLESLSKV